MARGGARPGSGPKRKLLPKSGAATPEARRRSAILYEALTREHKETDSPEIQHWRKFTNHTDAGIASGLLWKLFEHSEGRAVHTVNHLHDKAIEMNVTVSLAETVEKARKRAGV